ncbi:50S ribosome-binding GTPase [Fictibacillus sp. B-59209]|uniref:dynamin family protein n=1 Tax=Fictibacillus sp. B-59209 TaxID=3024873 RepID=UPI002E1A88D0|nr:50S ribosome-binding GTPase [Fictibacillus sp. B-59209]
MKMNQSYNVFLYAEKYRELQRLLSDKHKLYYKEKLTRHFNEAYHTAKNHKLEINNHIIGSDAKLIQPVLNELESLGLKFQELENGLKDKFLLFIVGMGNVGKSTVINSLLEHEAAEIDFLPKTWKIDVFENNNSVCLLKFKNGTSKKLSIKDTKEFINLEEMKVADSKKQKKEALKKIAPSLKTIEEKRELEKTLEEQYLYKSDLVEVRWPVPENRLSEKFKLVDTPGLVQENLSGETKMNLQEYYHKADGVIWLLDANKIAHGKSKEMISELKEAIENIGGKTNNIIAVINRIDLIQHNSEVKSVLEQAPLLLGEFFSKFIPISAKKALDGYKTKNTELREASGILDLYDEIESRFFKQAQIIRLESKLTSFRHQVKLLDEPEYILNEYLTRLKKDQNSFEKKEQNIATVFKEIRKEFINELEKSKEHLITRVNKRIDQFTEGLYDKSSYEKKEYMNNTIFRVNEVEDQLKGILSYWRGKIDETSKTLVNENEFHEFEHINDQIMQSFFYISTKGDQKDEGLVESKKILKYSSVPLGTNMESMEDFFLNLFGESLGGIFNSFGKGIAKFFTLNNVKRQLKDSFKTNIGSYTTEIKKEIDNQINHQKVSLLEAMDQSYSRLHGYYKNSLLIKDSLETFKHSINQKYNPPMLLDILKQDKMKISNKEIINEII